MQGHGGASLHDAAPAAPVGALSQCQATAAPGRRDCSHNPGHLVTGGERDSAGGERGWGRRFPSVRWQRPERRTDCPTWRRQPTPRFAGIMRQHRRCLAVMRARGTIRVRVRRVREWSEGRAGGGWPRAGEPVGGPIGQMGQIQPNFFWTSLIQFKSTWAIFNYYVF
jgi:hypothetical protein